MSRTVQTDGSIALELSEPIQYGKEEMIAQLIFAKPKAKHVKGMKIQDLSVKDILDLAGRLCGRAPSVMDELGMRDLGEVTDIIADFLGDMAPKKI